MTSPEKPKPPEKDDASNHATRSRNTELLAAKADQLIVAMGEVAEASGVEVSALRDRQRRQRWLIWALSASVFLVVLLTAAIAVTGIGVIRNSDRLENNQRRVGQEVLCPFFAATLATENNPHENSNPKEMAAIFKSIRHSWDVLGCGIDQDWSRK
ncbi:hypothetical protein [Streptomyces microflavus]|uniref:hypothetical protein n=1 Tax=Streptomyces microflavus TaxID=1919 RepID=UPI0036A2C942